MSLFKFVQGDDVDIDADAQNKILENQLVQLKLKVEEAKWVVEMQKLRPCHLYPVKISHDGLQWLCTSGVCEDAVGSGESPGAAMLAFDKMWAGVKDDGVAG